MATTITSGATTITPELVTGWETDQETRNIIHPIIGSANPDVTLKPANLRTGTIELLFLTASDANDARLAHATGGVFQLVSTELSVVDMYYVVSGNINTVLEDSTRNVWTLSVDYQEVTV